MENNITPSNELTAGPLGRSPLGHSPTGEPMGEVKRNLPRDVFLHLLAMVTLYWSAISFITLCHEALNYFFPDIINYGYMGVTGSMRFAVSSLIIVFPIFILSSWFLNRIYAKESAVRESKIRKWLIYLTLFVAALVIIGDLVFVINTFLNGEVTIRFILKALSIIMVAGAIFGYYLDDVRRNISSPSAKYFAWVSSLVVALAIIGSFFIIGSPMNAGLARVDQQRVNDLQGIQYQVVNYWQRKQALPTNLKDLNDPISGYAVPVDPKTKLPYEYTVKDATNLSFELCATFETAAMANNPKTAPVPAGYYDAYSQNFDHAAGRVCFDRTIDKQLYPPITNPAK
ncbi:MAG: hypothetical protein A3C50_00265 [Candidatus Staskawiczbacteria bacterium RIFCSPHIGHO2_02_FULL_43_16]|uniref:DUF5671 domain-containing protein n=1 Tax=Candidatus Staskawiczbacteria bacterium RIFCSPHIGHO2_01_FULL_41_41 TaxID=1802203 RepID=A0A1G2HXB3_9BACT|nr:MAG: hypothetical protein A2822_01930 [Candidatus Staskawiczbacteria bacterium RIFCSPHIGHO2_01_FULL_41_41]OGZ68923.1 MAG: hypothetical protein A3C50_00265 [Candidatus Staskawiczbacteria bacterium RIFCSPHIGHO2_02_FULL_43_16]OGZ74895.1 MAG: hypothetical protein A3A12_03550 [Candidatus Staskawiczbacteria bacterium RIFCSPLOWO2_01_FULL_43_17b]